MSCDPAIASVVFWLARGAESGHSVLLTFSDATTADDVSTATPADLAALLESLEPRTIDGDALHAALGRSVDAARYWQEPDGVDAIAALPEISSALAGVSAAIVASPRADEWNAAHGGSQWAVEWCAAAESSPVPSNASTLLAEWVNAQRGDEQRATLDRSRDPYAPITGVWWSVPTALLGTRGRGIDALDLVEDSLGWNVATVIPIKGDGRICEITCAEDWARLCLRYPLEVTASRRHDWFRATGRDDRRWLIPDWQRMSHDVDAVHLTTLGYLSAATTAIDIDAEYATVIAGWGPDATLWITDTAREGSGPRQEWRRSSSNGAWVRQGG